MVRHVFSACWFGLALLLVLNSFVEFGQADIIKHPEFQLNKRSLMTIWVTEMYASGDVDSAPPGYGRSEVAVDVRLDRSSSFPDPTKAPSTFVEVVIANANTLEHVGATNNHQLICCGNSTMGIPGCSTSSDVGRLILTPEVMKVYGIHRTMVRMDEGVVQRTQLVTQTGLRTGMYMLYISSCDADTSILVKTMSKWLNPYGYLPGHLYGYLLLYKGLSITYGILTCLWGALCIWYRKVSHI